MHNVNLHQAKTQLSRLLVLPTAGEELVIAKAGKPLARLVPYQPPRGKRRLERSAGLMRVPEDFDAPLPLSIQKGFMR
jgi:antitoxin (DNA-binding transcriptional repressor) of toxin-antitoxin stability system